MIHSGFSFSTKQVYKSDFRASNYLQLFFFWSSHFFRTHDVGEQSEGTGRAAKATFDDQCASRWKPTNLRWLKKLVAFIESVGLEKLLSLSNIRNFGSVKFLGWNCNSWKLDLIMFHSRVVESLNLTEFWSGKGHNEHQPRNPNLFF